MIFKTDIDDFERTRKSLLATSWAVIIISNLTLLTDQAEIFGLKFAVSKHAIVTLGQILVFLLLAALLLRALPDLMHQASSALKEIDEKWRKREREAISALEDQARSDGSEMQFEDLDPWDQHYFLESQRRNKRQERLELASAMTSWFVVAVLDVGFVLALAVLALIHPEFLSQLLEHRD